MPHHILLKLSHILTPAHTQISAVTVCVYTAWEGSAHTHFISEASLYTKSVEKGSVLSFISAARERRTQL